MRNGYKVGNEKETQSYRNLTGILRLWLHPQIGDHFKGFTRRMAWFISWTGDPGCWVENSQQRSRAEAEIVLEGYILKRNNGLLAFPYLFLDSFSVYQGHFEQIIPSLYIFLFTEKANWFKVIFMFLPGPAVCGSWICTFIKRDFPQYLIKHWWF